MTDYTNTDGCLTRYAETFDFYMESGRLPDNADPTDTLLDFVIDAVDLNPIGPNSDPEKPEIIRQTALPLLGELVEEMAAAQTEGRRELELIDTFEAASLEKKRQMWSAVSSLISERYSVLEVNLPGYISQFATDDREAVFAALISDWRSACLERIARQAETLAKTRKPYFTQALSAGIRADYEERRRVSQMMFRYPQLADIIDAIGREKESDPNTEDSVIFCFIPSAVARNSSMREIDRVESGDNLERVMPAELSMPDDLFFSRYAMKELRQFGSPADDCPRRTEQHHPAPRLIKGPIIAAVDTSASMYGKPLEIAFSLIRQLTDMAIRQKRSCFLIQFSVRTTTIDLSLTRNRGRLGSFLSEGYCGGTDGEQMLSDAIRKLSSNKYEMADVLIISDLKFPAPSRGTALAIRREQTLGTRFYALQIGHSGHLYGSILDRVWQI